MAEFCTTSILEFLLRLQVRNNGIDLRVVQHLAEGGHLASSKLQNVFHTLVVGRRAAGQELLVEHALQVRPLGGHTAVWLMALLAVRDEQLLAAQLGGIQVATKALAFLSTADDEEDDGKGDKDQSQKRNTERAEKGIRNDGAREISSWVQTTIISGDHVSNPEGFYRSLSAFSAFSVFLF
jgi:hypothetical protein